MFLSEGCRSEGCKSVPSLFGVKHLSTGLIMGENACPYERWPLSCGYAAGPPS